MFPICRLSDQRCVIAAEIAVGFMKHKPAYSVQPSWGSFLPQRQELRPGAAGERTAGNPDVIRCINMPYVAITKILKTVYFISKRSLFQDFGS